jgi:hypothetical protein
MAVWATICSLPSDQAPGPDRYTDRFYKGCCSVTKPDIMAALLTLQQGNSLHLLVDFTARQSWDPSECKVFYGLLLETSV